MLTGFQQFLAACIGHTEEETDQPDDVQRDDESQTESEITTDDNSVEDTESTDTPVSEHQETQENDVLSHWRKQRLRRMMLPLSLQMRARKHTLTAIQASQMKPRNRRGRRV